MLDCLCCKQLKWFDFPGETLTDLPPKRNCVPFTSRDTAPPSSSCRRGRTEGPGSVSLRSLVPPLPRSGLSSHQERCRDHTKWVQAEGGGAAPLVEAGGRME